MAQQPKIWTRDFTLLFCNRVISASVFQMYLAALGLFTLTKYDTTTAIAGLVTGTFVIGGLIIRLLLGHYTDIWGRHNTMKFGSILFCACMIAYNFDLSLPALVVLRFIHGVSWGLTANTVNIVMASIIPRERFSEGINIGAIASTLGGGVGPFLALSVVQFFGYSTLFICGAVLGVLSVVIIFIVPVTEVPKESVEKIKSERGFSLAKLFHIPSLPMSLVVFIMCVIFGAVLSFEETYSVEVGLGEVASLYFIAYTVGQIITRPLVGKMMDRLGDNMAMFLSFAAFAAGLLLFSQMHTAVELVIAALLIAAGYGCLFSGSQAIIVRPTTGTQLSMANTTYYIFADGGAGFGPMIAGSFVPLLGYSGIYIASAILIVALAGAYWLVHGRNARRPNTLS